MLRYLINPLNNFLVENIQIEAFLLYFNIEIKLKQIKTIIITCNSLANDNIVKIHLIHYRLLNRHFFQIHITYPDKSRSIYFGNAALQGPHDTLAAIQSSNIDSREPWFRPRKFDNQHQLRPARAFHLSSRSRTRYVYTRARVRSRTHTSSCPV